MENIINDRGCVLILNHQCLLDLIVDFYILSTIPTTIIAKHEVLMIPFFGWIPWFTDHIFIDRSKPKEAKRIILEKGKKAIIEKNVSYSILTLYTFLFNKLNIIFKCSIK